MWEEREAPGYLLYRLRDVNQNAELIHLIRDQWLLVTMDGDDALKAQGRRVLEATRKANAGFCAKHPFVNPRSVDRLTVGLKVALLKSLGARTVGIYTTRMPDSAIVEDYRRADFMSRHDTESSFWAAYDAPKEREREAQLKDLTDPARASDAWRYANTLTHHVGGKMAASFKPDRSSFRRAVTINS
jgi:hypothetical protein